MSTPAPTPAPSADASSGPEYTAWDLGEIIAAELGKPKPWWQSRGMWGALMVLVAQGAQMAGLEIDSAALTDAVLSGITLLGAVLAWWGRVKATRPISRRDVAPGLSVGAPREQRMREPGLAHEHLPPDAVRPPGGYWSGDRERGPFGDA
jgi:hypothetical protein